MPKRLGYTVTGEGEFPIDMLRYDASWPSRGEDATAIARSLIRRNLGRYTVRLNTDKLEVSERRWYSFGWTVEYDR